MPNVLTNMFLNPLEMATKTRVDIDKGRRPASLH